MSSNAEAEPTWPSTPGSQGQGNDEPDNPGRPAASGADEAQPSSKRVDKDKEHCCKICKAEKNGRKLIVALDGLLNQFGRKNSNVVEIYARIEKDGQQLSYYNSGIGTYANTTRSTIWKRTKLKLSSLFDMAFARNFEKIVLGAYRWLSDTYQPGDQIFLFGFSRGAYQVRVLAGMIEQVGLIYSGNEEQIPFAYQLYEQADDNMANHFKETFSHREVKVHFLGVWDTVSSVGVFGRKKDLPRTRSCDHVCHVRYALALDERRVKFNPEFFEPSTTDATRSHLSPRVGVERNLRTDLRINEQRDHVCHVCDALALNGGRVKFNPEVSQASTTDTTRSHLSSRVREERHIDLRNNEERDGAYTHLKEVWFAGCHSDVGGGNRPKDKLLMEDIPALWMANEAHIAGLKFKPTKVEWNMERLKYETPTESLTSLWWILEFLPFLHHPEGLQRREQSDRLPWWRCARLIHWLHSIAPHGGDHRYIRPDQKVHASVALKVGYTPRAQFKSSSDTAHSWHSILGKQHINQLVKIAGLRSTIEFDLYDTSSTVFLVQALRDFTNPTEVQSTLDRLLALAECDAGINAIVHVIVQADIESSDFNALKGFIIESSDFNSRKGFIIEFSALKDLITGHLTDEIRTRAIELVIRILSSQDPSNADILWKADFKSILMPLALAEGDESLQIKLAILLLYVPPVLPSGFYASRQYDSSIAKFAMHCLSTDAADVAIAVLFTLYEANPELAEQEALQSVRDAPIERTTKVFSSVVASTLRNHCIPAYIRISVLQQARLTSRVTLSAPKPSLFDSEEIANTIIHIANLPRRDILHSALRMFPQFVALYENSRVMHEKPVKEIRRWWQSLWSYQDESCRDESASDAIQFLELVVKHKEQGSGTIDLNNFLLSSAAVLNKQSIKLFKQTAKTQDLQELIRWLKQHEGAERFRPQYLMWLQKVIQQEADLLRGSALCLLFEIAPLYSHIHKIALGSADVANALAACLESDDLQVKASVLRQFNCAIVPSYMRFNDWREVIVLLIRLFKQDEVARHALHPLLKLLCHSEDPASEDLAYETTSGSFREEILKLGFKDLLLRMVRDGEWFKLNFDLILFMSEHKELREIMIQCEIIETTATFLRHSGWFQHTAAQLLCESIIHDELCPIILKTDLMNLFGHAGASEDTAWCKTVLESLTHISLQRVDVRAAILLHNVPSSIVQMLHSTFTWRSATVAIARMVENADICSAFLDVGTPDKLLQLLDEDHLSGRPEDYYHQANDVFNALRAFSCHDTAREYMLSVSFLSPVKQLLDVSNWGLNKIALEIFDLVTNDDDDLSSLRQLDILPRLEVLSRYPQGHPISRREKIRTKKLLRRIKESSKDEEAREGGESSGPSA